MDLERWCKINNAIEISIECFWKSFEKYKEEDKNEFFSVFKNERRGVSLCLDKISYDFDLPNFVRDQISIAMDIFLEDRQIGWFKQVFSIEGEPIDDFFIIE